MGLNIYMLRGGRGGQVGERRRGGGYLHDCIFSERIHVSLLLV